jgi:hypothetical protein
MREQTANNKDCPLKRTGKVFFPEEIIPPKGGKHVLDSRDPVYAGLYPMFDVSSDKIAKNK